MTADTLQSKPHFVFPSGRIAIRPTFHWVLSHMGYAAMVIAYFIILVLSIFTLGLIEIRQNNLMHFNGLVAALDERDSYQEDYFEKMGDRIDAALTAYQHWRSSLGCSDEIRTISATRQGEASAGVSRTSEVTANGGTATPQTPCQQADNDLNSLRLSKDNLLLRMANLPQYYDKYRDGIRTKAPQLIPILGLVDSSSPAVSWWARMPFELLEMFLLLFMGALGGMIGVSRCLVEPKMENPKARDLCYRPVAGAVIALGILILFRATQLFFGTAATASTSVFLLAGLGLASGFCAREAISKIETVASRVVRGGGGRDDDPPATNPPGPGSDTGGPASPPQAAPA
ncbi:MAG TPA: hypothetical protein VGF07_00160 [Stellaceae bacterium]